MKLAQPPAPQALVRAPGRGRELVALVSFSHALQHLYVAILPLTYPLVVAEFHVSYTTLGLLLAVVGVAGGLLQGTAGLYQRASARAVLTAQQLLMAGTAVLIAVAPSFAVFGAGRFLGAVVSSPQHAVGNGLLARTFPERRAAVLSWHTTGGNIGTLAVPLVASLLIARWGWRPALAVFAVPIALGGLVLAARLRDEGGTEAAARAAAASRTTRQAVLSRAALTVMAAGTIAAGGRGLGVINAYVPAYLHGIGLAQVMVGVVFSVLLGGSVVGPVIAGYLADRLGRRRVVLATYLAGAVAVAAFGSVGADLPALLVLGVLVGILAYAESPLLQALFADAVQGAPQQAAFGVFFAVSYGAGSIWVGVLGWAIDHLGFASAFWIMAGSFVAAGLVLLFGRPSAHRRPGA